VFEEDKDIFDTIIAPQMRKSVVTCPEPTPANPDPTEVEEEDVEPEEIVMTSRFNK